MNSNNPKTTQHNSPLVSVLIPTYNRGQYLRESIASALSQSVSPFEIVVVDDGSDDNTPNIVAAFHDPRLRYVRKEHSGAPATRNRAVQEAKGEFLLWIDSDDILLPNTLEIYYETLKKFPDADVIYGHLMITDEKLNVQAPLTYTDWYGRDHDLVPRLLQGNCVPNPGSMIKATCYEKTGLYNEEFPRAHDYEWWSRLALNAKLKHCGQFVVLYRWHDSNLSGGDRRKDLSYEAKIARNLLAKFKLKDLYPKIDWGIISNDQAEAVAKLRTSSLLLNLDDHENALKYLQEGCEHFRKFVNCKTINESQFHGEAKENQETHKNKTPTVEAASQLISRKYLEKNDNTTSGRYKFADAHFKPVESLLRQNRVGDALQLIDLTLDAEPLYEPAINKLRLFYEKLNPDFQREREQRVIEIINQVSGDPVKLQRELLKLVQFNEAPRAMILTKSLLMRGSSVNLPPRDISNPDVSVIIPLYNLGMYLPEALNSVRKQTNPNWECIIVNDESTDNSAEIAQSLIDEYNDPRIRLVHQHNKGLSAARNTGIRIAIGEFLVTLDPDDSITPDYFSVAVEALRKHSDLGWVYPITLQYGAVNRFWSFRAFDPLKLIARNINPCHAMQRKALWDDVGGYNEQMLKGYEDWDYWLSAYEKGWKAERISQIMLLYRKRKSSMLKEMDDVVEYEIKCEIMRNHPVFYKPINSEMQEKMQSKRRIPKELVNELFIKEWQQRNSELRQRLLNQIRQSSLIQ